jgi:hypothetical protein
MKKTYLMTINPNPVLKKPESKKEFSILSKGVASVTGLTYNELVKYSAPPYSLTICPSILVGERKNINSKGQQIFMLDFDSGIQPSEVIEKFKEFDITPNIIYYTFNHTDDHPRFRVILLLDEPIYDLNTAKSIRDGLIDSFEGVDKACKDASRMFLGGIKTEEISNIPIPLTKLINYSSIHLVLNDKFKTRKLDNFNNFYKKNNRSNLNYPKNDNQQYNATRIEYLENFKNNKFDFDTAIANVRILNDFNNGIELKYKQLFGLITSFVYINGGMKFIKNKMEYFNSIGKTKYKSNDFALISVLNKYRYLPNLLENYSPYKEDHKYTDIIDSVMKPRGVIDILVNHKKIKLCEASDTFDSEFKKVINFNDHLIYIFTTQTAIGKTTKLTKLENVTLSFPTHQLKDEVSLRMKTEHEVVPEIPVFVDENINETIKTYFKIGLNNEVYKFIKSIAESNQTIYNDKDLQNASIYLKKIESSYSTEKTVLTTHIRAIYDQYSHGIIVFDEDPIKSLITIKKFELSELITIENYYNQNQSISKLIDFIRLTPIGVISDVKDFDINKNDLALVISHYNPKNNILEFFKANYFYKDPKDPNIIHYCIKRKFPTNKKIIIMSATAQIDIYKYLYGDRVRIVEIPLAENKGKIEQYLKHGFSRRSMLKKDLTSLSNDIGDKPVITFLKLKNKFKYADEYVHFGNCEGYDHLNGKDIVLVGTPHNNELNYLFIAHSIGINLKELDCTLKDLKIDWKGYRFRFMSYEDERLRNIQLGIIEAELIQAAGRARSLRTEAKVLIYSNLPLQIADVFYLN